MSHIFGNSSSEVVPGDFQVQRVATQVDVVASGNLTAATEATNNLVKRVKRPAFGFTNFANYRIRALLYAGKHNWALLDTLTPTQNAKSPLTTKAA